MQSGDFLPCLHRQLGIEPNVLAIEDLDRLVPGRESEIVRFGTLDPILA